MSGSLSEDTQPAGGGSSAELGGNIKLTNDQETFLEITQSAFIIAL